MLWEIDGIRAFSREVDFSDFSPNFFKMVCICHILEAQGIAKVSLFSPSLSFN